MAALAWAGVASGVYAWVFGALTSRQVRRSLLPHPGAAGFVFGMAGGAVMIEALLLAVAPLDGIPRPPFGTLVDAYPVTVPALAVAAGLLYLALVQHRWAQVRVDAYLAKTDVDPGVQRRVRWERSAAAAGLAAGVLTLTGVLLSWRALT